MAKPHEAGADAGYAYLASAPLLVMSKPPGMAMSVVDSARCYYLTARNDDVNHAWPP